MANTTRTPLPTNPAGTLLGKLDDEIGAARAIPGALRAVHDLVNPWHAPADDTLHYVCKAELAQLFQVIAMASDRSLDRIEALTLELQAYKPRDGARGGQA